MDRFLAIPNMEMNTELKSNKFVVLVCLLVVRVDHTLCYGDGMGTERMSLSTNT